MKHKAKVLQLSFLDNNGGIEAKVRHRLDELKTRLAELQAEAKKIISRALTNQKPNTEIYLGLIRNYAQPYTTILKMAKGKKQNINAATLFLFFPLLFF